MKKFEPVRVTRRGAASCARNNKYQIPINLFWAEHTLPLQIRFLYRVYS